MKQIDAIVCDAGNIRLSDRVMARLGWEPHKPQRWHRNFIRRFYGVYPSRVGEEKVLAVPPAFRDTEGSDSRMIAALSR